jgi:GINS complex subunit 3
MLAERNYVKLEMPKVFGPRFSTNLLADPPHVNLKDRCFYFYELGLKLSLLVNDPSILSVLQEALASRFQGIIDRDPVRRDSTYNAFTAKLANAEEALFAQKYASALQRRRWRTGESGKIMKAPSIVNEEVGSKRKRSAQR